MSNPTQQSLAKLKRLVRYLKRERQWCHTFEYGRMAEEVTTFTDSGWASYKETRKSSSAGARRSCLQSVHAEAKDHCKKQGRDTELFAAALGASESKGIVSLLKNLGYEMKPVLALDAKAAEHILHRQGIGKLKHIYVAYLWMQDQIGSKRLRVRRVKSEENVADLGAKPLSKAVIAKHCLALGYVNMAEGNVSCKCKDAAIFWDFGSAVSLQQQTAGDHVQAEASRSSCSNNRSSGRVRIK